MFRKILFVLVFAFVSSVNTEWIPSNNFSETSSINWFIPDNNSKSNYARNFQDDDLESIDRAFNDFNNYNTEISERDDFKAIPFQVEPVQNGANNPVHFHTNVFPHSVQQTQQPQQNQPTQVHQSQNQQSRPFFTPPPPAFSSPVFSSPVNYPNFHSFQSSPQNLENFDSYLPPPVSSSFTNNVTNLELNTRHLLYLQPGKCSNSIEIVRIRDLEIKSTYKYGTDNLKSVCILMLYSSNENNKLAISMESVLETVSSEAATENWLKRNVKVYALHGGVLVETHIGANFGPSSPALILTKSNMVLLSINADRTLDFQIDISTYQSPSC